MPTYVYECSRCQRQLELVQSIADIFRPFCSECQDEPVMERIIQSTAFVLKGRGWGKDGYARKKK